MCALILYGTTSVTFADGSTDVKLTALRGVTVEGVRKVGVIILEQSSTEILVGRDFLKTFEVSLFVHTPGPLIALLDDAVVKKALSQILAAVLLAGPGPYRAVNSGWRSIARNGLPSKHSANCGSSSASERAR